ncbi:hypothetical protein [Neobacillus sp. FSL H8-0543]|uniref:hypothetical protein n=1 Tax=Neobacillus sp. FSL H8-0543 TaxID=2954672 RepID=UPI0031583977
MRVNNEVANSLEQLLEALIKMVGKTNQNMDGLQKRVSQLEWIIKEQQSQEHLVHWSRKETLAEKHQDPIRIPTHNTSNVQENIPYHL